MKYYEIWDVDADGNQGYARYDNESYFLTALANRQDDPFIHHIKWRIKGWRILHQDISYSELQEWKEKFNEDNK